jgi:hypothetical protein
MLDYGNRAGARLEIMSTHLADEHVKTVFAHYGLALYLSQCLELELAHALVYLDLIPQMVRTKEEWTAAFESFMDRKFEQTLGRLRNLRNVTSVPADLEDKLTQALKRKLACPPLFS